MGSSAFLPLADAKYCHNGGMAIAHQPVSACRGSTMAIKPLVPMCAPKGVGPLPP
jgi:hypothetical protein